MLQKHAPSCVHPFATKQLPKHPQITRIAHHQSPPHQQQPSTRRDALQQLLGTTAAMLFVADQGSSAAFALGQKEEDEFVTADQTTFKTLREPTLAYSFDYPVVSQNGRVLNMVFSRKPERYSSAAPLTADARQRIVCELADLINAVTITISVGPPSGTLRTTPQDSWTARQVAEQVLIDRSTARVTSGQRVSLNSVEAAITQVKDDTPYYIYEHIAQGSPTLTSNSRETYRHALAVSALRPGLEPGSLFLYTLNLSCPQGKWDELESGFRKCVESFVLWKDVGNEYVAPDQDPWMFF